MRRSITLLSVLVVVAIYMVACGGSQPKPAEREPISAEIPSAVEPTPSATIPVANTPTSVPPTDTPIPPTETSTPTPIALSDLDLESVLVKPNDLPSGMSGAQVSRILPGAYRNLPAADAQIRQQFEMEGQARGGVAVLLYSSPSRLEATFRLIEADLGDPKYEPSMKITRESIDGVGEYAVGSTMSSNTMGIRYDLSSLLFVRCHAVVNVSMSTANLQEVETYGQRLDERLISLVCDDKGDEWKDFNPDMSASPLADPVYALMSLRYVENIQEALDDLFGLVNSAGEDPMLAFDDTWKNEMSLAGLRLASDAEMVARLKPPKRFETFHSSLLESVGLLGDFGNVVLNGVYSGDPTTMTENIQDLWDGKAKFEALLSQLDDLREAALD